MTANVGTFLHRWARLDPGRTAIIDAGRDDLVVSYAELHRQASGVAAQLMDSGLGSGDRVAICTANGLDFVAAWFGTVYAGCTTLPIPVSSTAHEIAFRLEHASCRALITDAGRAQVAEASTARAGTPTEILLVHELLARSESGVVPCAVAPDALAMLLYTSGTTGAAKAVRITHRSLGAHSQALVEHTLHLGEDDRILGTLPLTHSYGIRTTLLLPFYAGARTVFIPKFSPTRTLELCAAHRITWIPGVPTMFVAWANEPGLTAPPALRWSMSAGAPLAEDVRLRAEQRLGAPVRQAYGLTEANLTAINAPPDEAVAGSSGKPIFGVELRIANEHSNEVPRGERGEVLVRGRNLMSGYLDDKLATAHVMRGGWLHTGDIGFVDGEGRLTIVDRSKDLILRGGASIYPSEIEAVLTDHVAVKDAAVVGRADEYYGEEVVAVVAANREVTASELDAWARERLAPYKLPRRYAFVKDLPRGASGKTLKRLLRNALAKGEIVAEPSAPHGTAE
ncbi:MAG: AMP-binding protein [Myxococcales bacterium]|nr:AMP-binding protein [Myxococcales bacterium]